MIDFQDFDFKDNARYAEYVKRCIQIPSVFAPQVLMSYKEPFEFQRGYAADLCWHKALTTALNFGCRQRVIGTKLIGRKSLPNTSAGNNFYVRAGVFG